jgi:hypothetical protein
MSALDEVLDPDGSPPPILEARAELAAMRRERDELLSMLESAASAAEAACTPSCRSCVPARARALIARIEGAPSRPSDYECPNCGRPMVPGAADLSSILGVMAFCSVDCKFSWRDRHATEGDT